MICIEKAPLLNELQNMIDGLDGKPWSKRDKVRELTRLRVFIQTRDEIDPVVGMHDYSAQVLFIWPVVDFCTQKGIECCFASAWHDTEGY